MKQKRMKFIIPSLILVALVLRTVQIFTVIEGETGFYKVGFSGIGTAITVVVALLCAVSAVIAKWLDNGFKNEGKSDKIITVTAGLVSIALFYEMLSESFVLQQFSWQVVFMKITGLLSAVYFAALVLSRFLSFKMPELCHTLPAFYMVIRIICSFINISSLSLIPENIFLIASYCTALLFFVAYASINCGVDLNGKSVYMRSVLAFSVCFVTAFSNLIVNATSFGGYSHISLSSQVVLTAMSLFIASFTYVNYFSHNE